MHHIWRQRGTRIGWSPPQVPETNPLTPLDPLTPPLRRGLGGVRVPRLGEGLFHPSELATTLWPGPAPADGVLPGGRRKRAARAPPAARVKSVELHNTPARAQHGHEREYQCVDVKGR